MQYAQGIPPELRSNIDYVFIFNEPSVANRKRIYEAYAGMIPSFEYFCNILDACTQNHECLIIKTSGNSSDIREQVFWYKAEAHTDFKVGHPDFWKYHKSNYNEKYEEEDDKNKEEFDKLKRKFAKTRKLKVIVSRQGDVVGYQQGD
jgi:nucleoside-diphosphate-sugar epimerase